MSNERVCKPGFNSCNIGADDYKTHQAAEARAARESAIVTDKKVCKPGFSSCSVDGEPRSMTPEVKVNGCKQGFSSCEI